MGTADDKTGKLERDLMLQAALFDFNGVLVDDERLHLAGFNAALAPYGVSVSLDLYNERYLGFDDRGAFSAMLRDHDRDPSPALVADLIAAKSLVYNDLAARSLDVFEGAPGLLRAAAAEVPVAIVSGALRGEIDAALRVMGCVGLARAIVAAEDVAACKPDPEGYLLGLSLLRSGGLDLDPSRCVAIEDSVAGVESARGAGLRVVAVAHTYGEAELRRAGADAVAGHVRELTLGALGEAVAHRR